MISEMLSYVIYHQRVELSCAVGDMALKADAVQFKRANRGLRRVSGMHDRAIAVSSFRNRN